MAKINVPYSDTALTPVQETPTVNTQALEGRTNQVQSELGALTDMSLKQADGFRQQAYAAELRAFDAEQNASLMKVLPAAMGDIGKILDDTSAKIANIDQVQFNENLQKEMDAYMLEQGYKVQEEYIYKMNELKEKPNVDAPKILSGWMTDKMKTIISAAPSEKARMAMTEKLMHMKLGALEDGFQIRHAAQAQARAVSHQKALNALVKQIDLDPFNPEQGMKQLESVASAMLNNGADPNYVSAVRKSTANQIYSGSVDAISKSKGPAAALEALSDPKYKANIDPAEYGNKVNSSVKAQLAAEYNTNKQLDDGIHLSSFSRGELAQGMKGAEQASNLHFSAYRSNMPNPSYFQSRQEADNFHKSDISYFRDFNRTVDKQSTMRLVNEATDFTASPWGAYASSKTLAKIINDRSDPAHELASQVVNNLTGPEDKQRLAAALKYADLVGNGMDIVQARDIAKQIMEPVNENVKSAREEMFKTFAGNDEAIIKEGANAALELGTTRFFKKNDPALGELKGSENYYAEYKQSIKDNYLITGDYTAAQQITDGEIKKNWRVTDINGKPELMKGAPEIYFDGRMDAIKEQKINNIKSFVDEQVKAGQNVKYDEATGDVLFIQSVKKPDGSIIEVPSRKQLGIEPIYLETNSPISKSEYKDVNGNIIPGKDLEVRQYNLVDVKTRYPIFKPDGVTPYTANFAIDRSKEAATLAKQDATVKAKQLDGKVGSSLVPKMMQHIDDNKMLDESEQKKLAMFVGMANPMFGLNFLPYLLPNKNKEGK